jgi:hypothetical protein
LLFRAHLILQQHSLHLVGGTRIAYRHSSARHRLKRHSAGTIAGALYERLLYRLLSAKADFQPAVPRVHQLDGLAGQVGFLSFPLVFCAI